MRRLIFLFFLLCASFFLYEDLIGLMIKAGVRVFAKSALAYRDLRLEKGQFILEDAILFDVSGGKSSYLLRSETICIDWTDLFSFSIRLKNPCLTLSADRFKNRFENRFAGFSDSPLSIEVEIEEGILEWSDGILPPGRFSYLSNGLDVSWEQGALKAYQTISGWRIIGTDLPLEFLSRFVPISDSSGIWSATLDAEADEKGELALCVRAEGTDLHCRLQNFSIAGCFALDWEAKEIKTFQIPSFFLATNRLRLSVEEASAISPFSEIRNAQLLGTFQAGLGAKWEGKGEGHVGSLILPIFAEGKAFIPPISATDLIWASAFCRFGNAEGNLAWEEGAWRFEWEGLAPSEGMFLQGLASAIDERAGMWKWTSGSIRGAIKSDKEQGIQWDCFEGTDLSLHSGLFEMGCRQVALKNGEWMIEEGRFTEGAIIEYRGDASWDSLARKASLKGVLVNDLFETVISFDPSFKEVSLAGVIGDLQFDGVGRACKGSKEWELVISHFEGSLPGWISQLNLPFSIQGGQILSIGSGFAAHLNLCEQIRLKSWSFACKVKECSIAYQKGKILHLEGELYANQDSFDWVGSRGLLSYSVGSKSIEAAISSPRIYWTPHGAAHFDIRFEEPHWDFFRIVGAKEKGAIQIDSNRSHLFGSPFALEECTWENGSLTRARFNGSVSCPLLKTFLEIGQFDFSAFPLDGDLELVGLFERDQNGWKATLDGRGKNWACEGEKIPFTCRIEGENEVWQLSILEFGPITASCCLTQSSDAWSMSRGKAAWAERGIAFDFQGKITRGLHIDLSLENFKADLSLASKIAFDFPLQGFVEGRGCITVNQQRVESDLDLFAKDLLFGEVYIENKKPLHLYATSEKKAYLTGIDCRIQRENLEGHACIDLIQADLQSGQIKVQKGRVHMPSDVVQANVWPFDPGREIDVCGDAEFSLDGSGFACVLQEAFFPIFGESRHIHTVDFCLTPQSFRLSALFSHRGKQVVFSGFVERGDFWRGKLSLQEQGSAAFSPLSIDWLYKEGDGLFIDSIRGAFAGVDASFYSIEEKKSSVLVGSAAINFQELSQWIPLDVAEVFNELEMGKGYELKGHLSIPKKNFSEISFQGLFCGKEIDLFGYKFRSLVAQADLSSKAVRIYDLKISDSAGILNIDDIRLQGGEGRPWTIEMPIVTIEDLRPSLFRKPGENAKAITPLLVRHLEMADFHGLLDDSKTYKAKGSLFFLNSFKRQNTVLDIPSNLFGRIIGLDLELLIPVEGDLSFELKDGYFQLTELKNAFSEGRRSEFFLVQSNASPRMDLKGNLQILVTMKQFVLFALTEAFMISIDGKLSDPEFSLQKKR